MPTIRHHDDSPINPLRPKQNDATDRNRPGFYRRQMQRDLIHFESLTESGGSKNFWTDRRSSLYMIWL